MIYLSSYSIQNQSITKVVEAIADAGIKNIELTGGTNWSYYNEEELHDIYTKNQLNFLVHNYFPPQKKDFVLNLSSCNPEIREKSFYLITQALQFGKKFNVELYSMHAGYVYDLSPQKDKNGLFIPKNMIKNSLDIFLNNLSEVITKYLPAGVNIAVENAFPAYGKMPFSMLGSAEEIFEFMDFCQSSERIGLLLDIGHLNVAASYHGFDKKAFLDKLFSDYSELIFQLHVSSNNGKEDSHDIVDSGCFELCFMEEYWNVLQKIPIVMEWHNQPFKNIISSYNEISNLFSSDPRS